VKIFYGICGEGLGHSGRSLALVERFTALGHAVTIFTFADALAALTKSGYQPHAIEGLRFGVNRAGGVSTLGTARKFCHYLRKRGESLDRIRQLALAERPDLVITDFEPLTALAAESLRIPCVSVDNQHRFCQPLGDDLPLRLQLYGKLAGQFVKRWIRRPQKSIVAVFHDCPPSPYFHRVEALIRDRIARLQPTAGDHLLVYAKGPLGRRMLEVAATVPARFIAYGCNGVDSANIEFKPTDYDAFAADLASCRGVLCSAGQQLIGESHYFGKPVLVVPMPNQHEQEINAHLARKDGIGDWSTIDALTSDRIQRSFDRRPTAARPGNGVDQVLELLEVRNGRS
jgi:uncharacterized protein (TIGR00661 family)